MIAQLSDFRPRVPAVAVFAEYRGRRYFLQTVASFPDAASVAEAFKHDLPRASLFCADVFDSTSIDGLACDLRNAYQEATQ
tara:strand:+ start:348 stop:590 length:243 start_codon:yes stop_codon:yes gene_type:complete